MDEVSSDTTRPDYLSEIFSLCTTLSNEAIDAAKKKAKESQFNVDRGEISYAELAINLGSTREILLDAINNHKLIQLPITVQKELLTNLQSVSRALQGIMSNTDEIVNLGNSVETLNTSVWKYGLHNLSEQVLGYQAKLNQLKQQEVRTKNLLDLLEKGEGASQRLISMGQQAENAVDQIGKMRLSVEQEITTIGNARQQAQDESAKAANAATNATQLESQISQTASSIKSASSEIAPLEASIRGFFSEVDAHRRQIASSTNEISKLLTDSNATVTREIDRLTAAAKATSEAQSNAHASAIEVTRTEFTELLTSFRQAEADRIGATNEASALQMKKEQEEHSSSLIAAEQKMVDLEKELKERSEQTIEKNNSDTKELLIELNVLKDRIKDQLAQATGYGQFGAFQSRQNRISRGKYVWVGGITGLVLLVISLTAYISFHAQQSDLHSAAFWIKLSMNIPLGFLITFCTIQYNRERRLEEEYAFKASISVSLTPYRELIYSILEKEGALKDGTYTNFVVDSVRNVFSSPTERIFDSHKAEEKIPEKALKAIAEIAGNVIKAAK